MDDAYESLQEYDPTHPEPVRVWVFCRDCRCRLQVRMVPRPDLGFSCLCGNRGVLRDFDVLEQEARAQEVAEAFETAYQATKEVLSGFIELKKTRMYDSGAFKALLEAGDEAAGGSSGPSAFETEAEYQGKLAPLMRALDASGSDLLARHEALVAIAEFTFARRHLRSAAKAFCVRACEADIKQLDALAANLRERSSAARLRFPTFRFLVEIHEEAHEFKEALRVARRAKRVGMPDLDEKIAELRAASSLPPA